MICIFCLSHVPALMFLDLDGFDNSNNILLLIFLIGVVQVSDVLQYVWGKLIGGAKIMPSLSPSKTISGTVGGIFVGHSHCRSDGADYAVLPRPSSRYRLYRLPDGFLWRPGYVCYQRDYGVKDWAI